METINLNKIHEDLMALKKEMEEIRIIIEEDFELADDVLEEIDFSRKRPVGEFISNEDMRKEFS